MLMNMARLLLGFGVAGFLVATAPQAFAQESPSFDPGSAVCGLINFAFCPQGVPLPPSLAGPDERPAAPDVKPIPVDATVPVHRKRRPKHATQPNG
jgi:hypothetical protein